MTNRDTAFRYNRTQDSILINKHSTGKRKFELKIINELDQWCQNNMW